jgi:hypothetical protein
MAVRLGSHHLLHHVLLLLLLLYACAQVNAGSFSCGQAAALYRNRSCGSTADAESQWYVAPDAKLNHRMIDISWFASHGVQDVLAGAAALAAAAAAGQRRSGGSSRQRTVNGKRSAAGRPWLFAFASAAAAGGGLNVCCCHVLCEVAAAGFQQLHCLC